MKLSDDVTHARDKDLSGPASSAELERAQRLLGDADASRDLLRGLKVIAVDAQQADNSFVDDKLHAVAKELQSVLELHLRVSGL